MAKPGRSREKSSPQSDPSGIVLYLHCRQCIATLPDGLSPREYVKVEVGLSQKGELIVWCLRHDILVCRLSGTPQMKGLVGAGCTCCDHRESGHVH